MTVTCALCGTANPTGNRFCVRCAAPLPPSPGNATVDPPPAWATSALERPSGEPQSGTPPASQPFGTPPASPPLLGDLPDPPGVSRRVRRVEPEERSWSPTVVTTVVAIVIVVVLAVVGVLAGQAIGA